MRIVFDENVPDCISVALTTLAEIAFPQELEITTVMLLGIAGEPDEQVLHAVGKDGILITYDKDFKRQRALYHIIKQHQIGVLGKATKSKNGLVACTTNGCPVGYYA